MHLLKLPRLGQTMEEGVILSWLVKEGDQFEPGTPLYEVETEKSQVEVEAKSTGAIARVVVAEGETAPVGAVLAVVAEGGETLTEEQVHRALESAAAPVEAPSPSESDGESGHTSPQAPAKRARSGRVRAMPRAKKLAAELGIELADVQGSGADGAITEADVRRAAGDALPVRERRRLSGLAKAQAEQMTRSWGIPQFSQDIEVDATRLRERREALKGEGLQASVTDLLIEAVTAAVGEVPEVNSSLVGEEMVVYEPVNVSVAIASDSGLVVPVLRGCDSMDLQARVAALSELVERARGGQLEPHDMAGGTITVSNLGGTGVTTGVPLLNAPQGCLVFVGATADKPVVRDGEVVVRPVMHVVIAYDHRILDGFTAARFTNALSKALEEM